MATTAGPGSVVAGRYRLARPLAADRVWLATDLSSADERVLKRLEPDVASRVGAAIGRGLAPLANVEVVGDPGDPWLAMPYLPGGEIGRLRGRPWRECVAATLPVVDALDALHTAGWVHGDLKAGNVVLDGSGVPRLVDFGCLRPVGSTRRSVARPGLRARRSVRASGPRPRTTSIPSVRCCTNS